MYKILNSQLIVEGYTQVHFVTVTDLGHSLLWGGHHLNEDRRHQLNKYRGFKGQPGSEYRLVAPPGG